MNKTDLGHLSLGIIFGLIAIAKAPCVRAKSKCDWHNILGGYPMSSLSKWMVYFSLIALELWEVSRATLSLKPNIFVIAIIVIDLSLILFVFLSDRHRFKGINNAEQAAPRNR
jgi:hypothetical protein